jgi:general secretion pathway protein G
MRARIQTLIFTFAVIASLCVFGCGGLGRSTSTREAQEYYMRQDLSVLRSAIDQYTLDKKNGPQRLEDLVSDGYMKRLPEDPITMRSDCWVPVREAASTAVDKKKLRIVDVHSCNDQLSSEGTAYSSW